MYVMVVKDTLKESMVKKDVLEMYRSIADRMCLGRVIYYKINEQLSMNWSGDGYIDIDNVRLQ